MSVPHFFTDSIDDDLIRITGEDARHAARALRITPGEEITVSDGAGHVARARAIDVTPSAVTAEVLARETVTEEAPRLIVCPAIPKSGRLEVETQKLTELGVAEIRPWPAARSVPRWDAAKARKHGERLRAIAYGAAKQSRRAFLPEVADPGPLAGLPTTTIVLHEEEDGRLSGALPAAAPSVIALIVGPEGGLTSGELDAFRAQGARVVGLGPQVLRTETATIVAATLVLGRFGRIG